MTVWVKLFFLLLLLSNISCFRFKTLGNATGYGGGNPVFSLLNARMEQMTAVIDLLESEGGADLFELPGQVCPPGIDTTYCAFVLALSANQKIYLTSLFMTSLTGLRSLLSRDSTAVFELVDSALIDEQGVELTVKTAYGPTGPIQIRESALALLTSVDLTVLIGQRAFNKVLPSSAFSSNSEPLPMDYIPDYENYPFSLQGKAITKGLGIAWMLALYASGDNCAELTSPLSRSWVFYGADRLLSAHQGGLPNADCNRAWEVGSETSGPGTLALPQGLHKATFSLGVKRVKGPLEADSVLALVQVVETRSKRILSQKAVRHSEFSDLQYRNIEMYFDNPKNASLDFRVRRVNPTEPLIYLGTLAEGVIGGQVFYPGFESYFSNAEARADEGKAMVWNGMVIGTMFGSEAIRTLHAGRSRFILFVSYRSERTELSGNFLRFVPTPTTLGPAVPIRFEDFSGPGAIHSFEASVQTPIAQGASYSVFYEDSQNAGEVQITLHGLAVIPDAASLNQSDTGTGVYDFSLATVSESPNSKSYYTADVSTGSYCRFLDPMEFKFTRNKSVDDPSLGQTDDPSIVSRSTRLPYLYDGGLCQVTRDQGLFRMHKDSYGYHRRYFRDSGDGKYCETYALALAPNLDLRLEITDPVLSDLPLLKRVRSLEYAGHCAEFPVAQSPQQCVPMPGGRSATVCGSVDETVELRDDGSFAGRCVRLNVPDPQGGNGAYLFGTHQLSFCGQRPGDYVWVQSWFMNYSPLRLPEGYYCTEFVGGTQPTPHERFFLCTQVAGHIRYRYTGSTEMWFEPFYVPERN